MNRAITTKYGYIAAEGLDKAMKIARDLLELDYQVFVQLDDCDIYLISYTYNDLSMGCDRFMLVTEEEENWVLESREFDKDAEIVPEEEEFEYDENFDGSEDIPF